LPYQERYLPVCVLSLTPGLHGRNKHFGLWGFPLNNHKNEFARVFIMTDNIQFSAGLFHFMNSIGRSP
jgi:hypothetical protein